MEPDISVAPADQRAQPFRFRLGYAPPHEPPIDDPGGRLDPPPHGLQVCVLHARLDLGLRHRSTGDARAHEAGTEDAQPLHRDRGGATGGVILLERGVGEEEPDELARHISDRELAEGDVFGGVACRGTMIQPRENDVDGAGLRRIVAEGLLEDLPPRHPRHDPAAELGAIEEGGDEAFRHRCTEGAALDQPPRGGHRRLPEDRRMHEFVHETKLERLDRTFALAGKNDVQRGA